MGSKKVVGHSAGALGSEKTAQFKSLQTMAVRWAKVEKSWVRTYVKEYTDWPSVLSPVRREYTAEAESALTCTEPQNLIEKINSEGGPD